MKFPEPGFIFYCARSGSTLLARHLVEMAGFSIPPESNFVTQLIDASPQPFFLNDQKESSISDRQALARCLDIIYTEQKFADWHIPRSDLERQLDNEGYPLSISTCVQVILRLYRDINFPHAVHSVIKKGSYISYADQLLAMFPGAKFICIIRDGRAVFNSQKQSIYSVTGKPFQTVPACAAKEWVKYVEKVRILKRRHPTSVLVVHYEALVAQPEEIVLRVADFVSPQGKQTASGNYVVPNRYGDLHKNIGKRAMPERAAAWRAELSSEEIASYQRIAGADLLREGYPLEHVPSFGMRQIMLSKFKSVIWFKSRYCDTASTSNVIV